MFSKKTLKSTYDSIWYCPDYQADSYLAEEAVAHILAPVANLLHRIYDNLWWWMIWIPLVGVVQGLPQQALLDVIEEKLSTLHPMVNID